MSYRDDLGGDTVILPIYPKQHQKELWEDIKRDDKSLSRFIIDTVNKSVAQQKTGPTQSSAPHPETEERIQDLQNRVQELEEIVKDEVDEESSLTISDPNFIKQFLPATGTKLRDELVRDVVESDSFEESLRNSIEDALYELAKQNKAEYSRGRTTGWKLTGE